MIPQRYELLMESLRANVSQLLGIDLLSDAKLDSKGRFEGRLYMENPHFNVQYAFLRVRQSASAPGTYEVELKTEMFPGINEFSKYFPRTKSNVLVRRVASATRAGIAKFEGKPANVLIERDIAVNAAYLVAAEGGAGVALGAFLGFLLTLTSRGTLYGGAIGGAIGASAMLFLIFRMFD
ncbi:MAG: hypothetical protein HY247_06300 [archaeon]|nr:MAG: hypothetical protein HY247_06300 [archaeon]